MHNIFSMTSQKMVRISKISDESASPNSRYRHSIHSSQPRCMGIDKLQIEMKPFSPIGGLVPDACLWLGPPWLNMRFSVSPTHEPFSVSSKCVNLIRLLLCDDPLHVHKLGRFTRAK